MQSTQGEPHQQVKQHECGAGSQEGNRRWRLWRQPSCLKWPPQPMQSLLLKLL